MEDMPLALEYFKLKEKALLQREYIDYMMVEHVKTLKEGSATIGKAQLEAFQKGKRILEHDKPVAAGIYSRQLPVEEIH